MRDIICHFNLIYKHIKKNTDTTFMRNACLYARTTQYKINDLVWVYSSVKVANKPKKITYSWVRPYRVISRPAEVLLELKPTSTEGQTIVVHVS